MFLVNIPFVYTSERWKILMSNIPANAPQATSKSSGGTLVTCVEHRGEREPWVDLFVMIEQCKFHPTWIVGIDMSLLQNL